ncbi:MAG TPA: endo-1,3-alpha-glucanase family glycosylhydrolase [Roseiflexaceae bacterium]|nr:endo-1,3-alpha-glucanase family glycosylhydrolase [Roseiflexaceae bacterium]
MSWHAITQAAPSAAPQAALEEGRMFAEYVTCEVTIHPPSGSSTPLSIRSPAGDANGLLRLPTANPAYQRLLARLDTLQVDQETLTQLGRMLFEALFSDELVRAVLLRCQGSLDDHQGMRLRLAIENEDPLIAAQPWELLYDPLRGEPLVLLDTPILRYVPSRMALPELEAPLPLRLLLTSAQTGQAIDLEREVAALREALAPIAAHVELVVEPHLTVQRLQRLLREEFQIWHFIGAAAFDAGRTRGQLLFEDGRGGVQAVDQRQLLILLNRSGLRLATLDIVEGGLPRPDPLQLLAPALLQAQTAAVIAARFSDPARSRGAFMAEFYRTLAEGRPLDACVTEARKAVMVETGIDTPDWGMPVAYARAPDGRLFAPPVIARGELAARVNPQVGTLLGPVAGPARIERLPLTPLAQRPPRDFRDRAEALAALREDELKPGRGAWLTGPAGCGHTALLSQAANLPEAALPDGVVYLNGAAEPGDLDDIVQQLFRRFYLTEPPVLATTELAQTYLGPLQALFLFDQLRLPRPDLVDLQNMLPRGAVLIAASGPAPDSLRDLRLDALPRADAVALALSSARIEQPDAATAVLVERLCAALGDLPLPLRLLGRLVRAGRAPLERAVPVLEEMSAQIDPVERAARVLLLVLKPEEGLVLAALVRSGFDADRDLLEAVSGQPADAVDRALEQLVELGLVDGDGRRYTLVSGSLRRALDRLIDPGDQRDRAAAFLLAAGGANAGNLAWLAANKASLLAAVEHALASGQPALAGQLAQIAQPALVLEGQWGSWGRLIGQAAEAARRSGDRAMEAWSLHERGSRAGLLGDRATAQADLERALDLRRALGDGAGSAASAHNLRILVPPPPVPPQRPPDDTASDDSPEAPTPRRRLSPLVLALVALVLVALVLFQVVNPLNSGIALSGPTATATAAPTETLPPTAISIPPSNTPTPTATPTDTPVPTDAPTPTETPTAIPTATPTATPTETPTPIPTAVLTATRPVIAFYYPWYEESDWTERAGWLSDMPEPPYSGGDEATMLRHIEQAKGAGIDALACIWFGPDEERLTARCAQLLRLAEQHGEGRLSVAIFVDSASFRRTLFTAPGMATAVGYVLQNYAESPAYFRFGDRPALFFWDATRMSPETWQSVRDATDPDRGLFWFGGTDQVAFWDPFDAPFFFDITWADDPQRALDSYAAKLKRYNTATGRQTPFIGTVMPGYDDTRNPERAQQHARDRADGDYYRRSWEAAIGYRADAVLIGTFNEFFEGSHIEPSRNFGRQYLDLTAEWVKRYKNNP